MLLRRTLLPAAFCCTCVVTREAVAQQQPRTLTLRVTVVDSTSRVAIPGAFVIMGGDRARATRTDDKGAATLRVSLSHADTLRVSARGYATRERPIDVRGEDILVFDVQLAPAVQVLAERRITEAHGATIDLSRLAGYNRRLAAGRGRFITRDQVAMRGSGRVSDLFRGIPGLRVVDSASARLLVSSRAAQSSLVSKSANNDCVVPVAVDGLLREGSFQVDLLAPDEIEGIEVFTGIGTIPPEYSSMRKNAWCGLILIWTRGR